jgi:hypothetical protein
MHLQVAKKQKQLREERLTLMKQKVKEEFGRDLKIKYDKNIQDETEEELLALEADQVKDQHDLQGKDITVRGSKGLYHNSYEFPGNPQPIPARRTRNESHAVE